jgi:hypothetical protein
MTNHTVREITTYFFEGELMTARGVKTLLGAENGGPDLDGLLDTVARERLVDRATCTDSWMLPQVAQSVDSDDTLFDGYDGRGMPVYIERSQVR